MLQHCHTRKFLEERRYLPCEVGMESIVSISWVLRKPVFRPWTEDGRFLWVGLIS